MHLVKKHIYTTTPNSNDRSGTVERCNTVMQATAKKTSSSNQAIEVRMNVDDPMTKLAPRPGKSKTRLIIPRMV